MVSKGFFRGSRDLVERNDGRYRFFQYRGEQCLSALVKAGRGVVRLQSPPFEHKIEYLDVLSDINDHYFEVRTFERNVRGKFYRYDEEAERRFRSAVTEELSRSVEQFHHLLMAHDRLLEPAVDAGEHPSAESTPLERLSTVSRYTGYAVRGGWYPIIESYDHSLDPESESPRRNGDDGSDYTGNRRFRVSHNYSTRRCSNKLRTTISSD